MNKMIFPFTIYLFIIFNVPTTFAQPIPEIPIEMSYFENVSSLVQNLTDQGVKVKRFGPLIWESSIRFLTENEDKSWSRRGFKFYNTSIDFTIELAGSSFLHSGGELFGFQHNITQDIYANHSYILGIQASEINTYPPTYVLFDGKKYWDIENDQTLKIDYPAFTWYYGVVIPFYGGDMPSCTSKEKCRPSIDFIVNTTHSDKDSDLNVSSMRKWTISDLGEVRINVLDRTVVDVNLPLLEKYSLPYISNFDTTRLEWEPYEYYHPDKSVDSLFLKFEKPPYETEETWNTVTWDSYCNRNESLPSYYVDYTDAYDVFFDYAGQNTICYRLWIRGWSEGPPQDILNYYRSREDKIKYFFMHIGEGALLPYVPWDNVTSATNILLNEFPSTKVIWFLTEVAKEYAQRNGQNILNNRSATTDPSRVIIVYNTDYSSKPSYHYYMYGDADQMDVKDIHGQNDEIIISNVRGSGRTYGRPYSIHFDAYQYPKRNNDTIEQNYMLQYFSGSKSQARQYNGYVGVEELKNYINGEMNLVFRNIRFMKRHPKLGEQIVKIGVVRGDKDVWDISSFPIYSANGANNAYFKHGNVIAYNINESGTLTSLGHTRYYKAKNNPYLFDFDLLDVFFPYYGNWWATNITRTLTGTPYGPVDMVPWNIPQDKLDTYDLALFLGQNTMNDTQYNTLFNYVNQGGTLIMSSSHLTSDTGGLYNGGDVSTLFGVVVTGESSVVNPMNVIGDSAYFGKTSLGTIDPLFMNFIPVNYATVNVVSADTISWNESGEPLMVHKKIGNGDAYLILTEHTFEHPSIRNFIELLSGKIKILDFTPFSNRLEYVVMNKSNDIILTFFNHDRIGVGGFADNMAQTGPVWSGTITVNLTKLDLGQADVYEVIGVDGESFERVVRNNSDFLMFKEVESTQTGDELTFDLNIDRRSEVILGQSTQAINDFLSVDIPYVITNESDIIEAHYKDDMSFVADCTGTVIKKVYAPNKPSRITQDGVEITYDETLATTPSWKYENKLVTVKFSCE